MNAIPNAGALLELVVATAILAIGAIRDIQERAVENEVMLMGGACGLGLSILSGRLITRPGLYLAAVTISLILGVGLYRVGAVGGADSKMLVILAITSPGIALDRSNVMWEGFIAASMEVLIMLLLGYMWWVYARRRNRPCVKPPLIATLLVGFVIVQLCPILWTPMM